jgi:hypothetical protein
MRIPLNFCDQDGWLVPATHPENHDRIDWQWPDRHPVRACSHLVCTRCGAPVRPDEDAASLEAVGIVPSADAEAARESNLRIYRCKCSSAAIPLPISTQRMRDDGPALALPAVPWVCAGHEPAHLPLAFEGLLILDVASCRFALAEIAEQGGPDLDATIGAIVFRLSAGPLHDVARDWLRDAITAESAAHRSAAIRFWRRHCDEPDEGALLRALSEQAPLYTDTPDPHEPAADLESGIVRAIARRTQRAAHADPRALSILRNFALRSALSDHVLPALVAHDTPWVLQHAAALMSTTPQSATKLRMALRLRGIDPARLPPAPTTPARPDDRN